MFIFINKTFQEKENVDNKVLSSLGTKTDDVIVRVCVCGVWIFFSYVQMESNKKNSHQNSRIIDSFLTKTPRLSLSLSLSLSLALFYL